MNPVLMIKLLVLQAWYSLSDPELERQASNRIDFMHFLGYPKKAPDYSTVWRFRERLAETGRDKLRNRRISRRRCPGERPFAVIKRVFHSGHVLVTSLPRVRVKMTFACLCFNLVQLGRLGVGRVA